MPRELIVALVTGASLAIVSGGHCAVMCGPLAVASRARVGASATLRSIASSEPAAKTPAPITARRVGVSIMSSTPVATITMDDGKVNALSSAMLDELGVAFDQAESEAVTAVVLAAALSALLPIAVAALLGATSPGSGGGSSAPASTR